MEKYFRITEKNVPDYNTLVKTNKRGVFIWDTYDNTWKPLPPFRSEYSFLRGMKRYPEYIVDYVGNDFKSAQLLVELVS